MTYCKTGRPHKEERLLLKTGAPSIWMYDLFFFFSKYQEKRDRHKEKLGEAKEVYLRETVWRDEKIKEQERELRILAKRAEKVLLTSGECVHSSPLTPFVQSLNYSNSFLAGLHLKAWSSLLRTLLWVPLAARIRFKTEGLPSKPKMVKLSITCQPLSGHGSQRLKNYVETFLSFGTQVGKQTSHQNCWDSHCSQNHLTRRKLLNFFQQTEEASLHGALKRTTTSSSHKLT